MLSLYTMPNLEDKAKNFGDIIKNRIDRLKDYVIKFIDRFVVCRKTVNNSIKHIWKLLLIQDVTNDNALDRFRFRSTVNFMRLNEVIASNLTVENLYWVKFLLFLKFWDSELLTIICLSLKWASESHCGWYAKFSLILNHLFHICSLMFVWTEKIA